MGGRREDGNTVFQGCGVARKGGQFACEQSRTLSGSGRMKEEDGEFSFRGRVQEDGVIAIGMKAASDAGVGWLLDTQALGCESNATVWADAGLGADAPDVRPPRAARRRARAHFLLSLRYAPAQQKTRCPALVAQCPALLAQCPALLAPRHTVFQGEAVGRAWGFASGRKIALQGDGKFEYRSTKSETLPNVKKEKIRKTERASSPFDHSLFGNSSLFRISRFGFRDLLAKPAVTKNPSKSHSTSVVWCGDRFPTSGRRRGRRCDCGPALFRPAIRPRFSSSRRRA